jgi:membrane-associated protein
MEFLHYLTDPAWIMQYGGLYFIVFIVFAETGLFAGFFLPGDSLLFITGMIIAQSALPGTAAAGNLLYWIMLIAAAGIAGNYTGYWFGRRSGTILLQRRDTWLFRKKYLYQAKAFYERKGGAAIVVARFLPVVRTFAPIVAGMVTMDLKKFSLYNILGSLTWVGSLVSAGYLLGDYEWVKENLEKIVLGIALVTTLPVIIKMVAGRRKRDQLNTAAINIAAEQTSKTT